MSLPKVYLAKSNRANPDVVSRVRQALSKFPIQIVEYTGGQFSHAPMMECEQLVVVPDLDDEEIVIGKGLYEQITKFGRSKGYEYIFVINDEEDLTFKELNQIDIIDYDDYIAHAVVEFCRGDGEKLVSCFEDIYGVTDTDSLYSSGKSDSKYYQLIGRKK
jgi:hypothetical protein